MKKGYTALLRKYFFCKFKIEISKNSIIRHSITYSQKKLIGLKLIKLEQTKLFGRKLLQKSKMKMKVYLLDFDERQSVLLDTISQRM